jgi:hypothetical protein
MNCNEEGSLAGQETKYIWSWVPRGQEPRMTVLTRPSVKLLDQTRTGQYSGNASDVYFECLRFESRLPWLKLSWLFLVSPVRLWVVCLSGHDRSLPTRFHVIIHLGSASTMGTKCTSQFSAVVSYVVIRKLLASVFNIYFWYSCTGRKFSRSQWHEPSSHAGTLGSWVRIPLEAWMSVCVYSVFVAALRRADPPSKKSYRLCMD